MGKSKTPKQSTKPYKQYLSYLDSVDTSNVDNTLNNLTDYASNASNQLSNMGNYNFSVDGSDDARTRAEQATYQAYVDKLTPQFQQQMTDYATMLQNQGIPVGSEAYNRAMGELEEKQNDALNQAAYQSVLSGQNAFSQSLSDEINAGSFGNSAQQAYINQLLSSTQGSPSEYEKQQNIYAAGTAKSAVDYENAKASAKSGLGGALTGAITGGLMGFAAGGPIGAAAGAGLGAYSGYNQNPYAQSQAGGLMSGAGSLLSGIASFKGAGK